MIEIQYAQETRLHQQLTALRQVIMRADPNVMVDGRFEQMIVTPTKIIDIARQLIEEQMQTPINPSSSNHSSIMPRL